MTIYLRQSTASQEVILGRFVDSGDGNTEETALTIANTDIKVWKTGATTLADKTSGGATHIANGIYYAVFDATDTNTIGPLEIHVHVAGALYVQKICMVLDEAVYDVIFGTAAISTLGGTAQTGDAYAIVASGTHGNAALKTLVDTVDSVADAILVDTAEIGTAGAGLTNINLPNQTMDIVGNITGNLSGSVGSVTGLAASNLDATISSRASQTSVDTIDDFLDTEVTAIKAKTDQLTFTVANQVDANALSLATTLRAGIRTNTALANFEILMTDSTTHAPATGLTVTVSRSIDGGAFAAGTLGAVTELSNGVYKFDFGAGDLNGAVVTLRAIATGADDLFLTIRTDP